MILNNSSDVMMAPFITKKRTGNILENTSFHLIEVCLEGNKSEISSLVWKMRENFSVSVTDCKVISPIHAIFYCHWSPKNNPNQHCSTKLGPTTTNLTAC